MARRVDEIELIGFAVVRLVEETHRPGLDGDAAFPLQVHVVQELALHLPLGHRVAQLDEPVRQRGFSVVDVCNDRKVANFVLFCHE